MFLRYFTLNYLYGNWTDLVSRTLYLIIVPPLRPGFDPRMGSSGKAGSLLAVGRQFTVHNPSELYVLVSSALPTTRRDMTCTVLKVTLNPK